MYTVTVGRWIWMEVEGEEIRRSHPDDHHRGEMGGSPRSGLQREAGS
jgi:hypothetical protein